MGFIEVFKISIVGAINDRPFSKKSLIRIGIMQAGDQWSPLQPKTEEYLYPTRNNAPLCRRGDL